MRAHQEQAAALLQLVLVLLVEQKLRILMTRRTVTLTMQLQPLKALLLRPKPQQLHLLKVLHQQPKLLLLKLQHQLLKALLLLQKQSSCTVRCI